MGLLQFSFMVDIFSALPVAMSKIGRRTFLNGGFVLAKVFNAFSAWLCDSGALSVQNIIVVEFVAGSIITSLWTRWGEKDKSKRGRERVP